MKQITILSLILFYASFSYGKPSDSLSIQKQVFVLQQKVSKLEGENENLKIQICHTSKDIDSLKQTVQINTHSINYTTDSLAAVKSSFNSKTEKITKNLRFHATWGIILGILCTLILLVISYFLYKRIRVGSNTINKISNAQKSLQEESVKLDNKLVEILTKQMQTQQLQSINSVQLDHSLALKVADEIVRMEANLSQMDSNIRGYKQLIRSINSLKDNYLARGYEIVDMIGKPYNEGMKVVANFVPDEKLKEGEQIITKIIKPQVNYNGEMIQTAQITVSQK